MPIAGEHEATQDSVCQVGSEPPKAGFLESVRKLASEKNIVLIFDEWYFIEKIR